MGLATINIKFNADLSEYSTKMQNSLRQIDKFGQSMQKLGRSFSTYLTLPVAAAGGAAIKMASDYEESINKVDVAFGGSNQIIKDFAKTSLESFGIAEGSALDMAATYGDMGTSLGLTQGKAAAMSKTLVGLAGDLSSFKNIGIAQANTALTGIFTGETESLKSLGIVMTETNLQQFALSQGIKVQIKDMDQASKVNLRYAYIMSVTKNAQGDFANTQGGAANQSRIFTESLKQLGQQFGQVILPYFTKMITAVNGVMKGFAEMSTAGKTTIVVVAGLAAVVGPLLVAIGAIASGIPPLVVGFTALRTAFTALSEAMLANSVLAVGLVFAATAASMLLFSSNTDKASSSVAKLTAAQTVVNKVTEDATAAIVAQKAELQSYLDIANDETKSKKERLAAIKEINKISPEYLGNLNLENIGTDKARVAIEKYNIALLQGAKARAAQETLQELYKKQIETQLQREKSEKTLVGLQDEANKKQFTSAQAQKQYNDLLNDKTGVLKSLREQEDASSEAQIAAVSKIYNDGKQYLDLLKEIGGEKDKEPKAVAPLDLKPIDTTLNIAFSEGTAAGFDAQIEKLKQFRDQVATTAEQVKTANDAIKSVEFGKALMLDPTSLITTAQTVEEMTTRIESSLKRSSEAMTANQAIMQATAADFSEKFNQVWLSTAATFAENLGSMLGSFADGGLSLSNVGNLFLGTLADMAIQVGKIAIAVGVGVGAIKKALASLNPVVAIAAGVALIALGTFAKSQLGDAGTPKFANGGVVGGSSFYGDKILARVNSGEMIANDTQQRNIWGAMNRGGGDVGGFVASTKLVGSDMLVLIERAQARKNRIG